MASMTLAEYVKRNRDGLIPGIVESIYTTDIWYQFCPWLPYAGMSGITCNRETTMGDSQMIGYGTAITAKSPSVVTPVTFSSTTVVGDAEINKKQIAESGGEGGQLVVDEIASKAKSVGDLIRRGIATGTGVLPQMNSLHTLCDPSQYTPTAGAGGAPLTLQRLYDLGQRVKSKGGRVDFYVASGREVAKLWGLMSNLGGVQMIEVKMGDGTFSALSFNGVPIFQNDYLSTTETDDGAALVGGTQSSVYSGVWDDGTRKLGLALFYPAGEDMGITFERVGAKENYDEEVYRIKSYVNLALFNNRGLARMTGVSGA
jgi:hypothetical protein